MYHLDTNACIRALNGTSAVLVERLQSHDPRDIGLSTVVKAELFYGARHSRRMAENLDLLRRFLLPFRSVSLDEVSGRPAFADLAAHQGGQVT